MYLQRTQGASETMEAKQALEHEWQKTASKYYITIVTMVSFNQMHGKIIIVM